MLMTGCGPRDAPVLFGEQCDDPFPAEILEVETGEVVFGEFVPTRRSSPVVDHRGQCRFPTRLGFRLSEPSRCIGVDVAVSDAGRAPISLNLPLQPSRAGDAGVAEAERWFYTAPLHVLSEGGPVEIRVSPFDPIRLEGSLADGGTGCMLHPADSSVNARLDADANPSGAAADAAP